jgi:hypothetical protein
MEMLFFHLALELVTVVICLKGDLFSRWDGQFLLMAITFFYFFAIPVAIEQLF